VSDLYKKMKETFDKIRSETTAGIGGSRYIPTRDGEDDDNPDNRPDFPYIEDPKGYKTHIPLEQDELKEQEEGEDEEMTPPEEAGEEAYEGAEGEMPPEEAPPPGQDPTAMGGMGMMGTPPEEKLTSTQLGRMYELKKIYSRLTSIEMFLSRTTDESILEIRKYVAQSISMFELVVSNFPEYKDKIDEIIVTYYEFLTNVYSSIRNYFSGVTKE